LYAMTLFIWHQTAFIVITMVGLLICCPKGLLAAPTSLAWVADRFAWLPVFAVVLAVLWAVFRRFERSPRGFAAPAPSNDGLNASGTSSETS